MTIRSYYGPPSAVTAIRTFAPDATKTALKPQPTPHAIRSNDPGNLVMSGLDKFAPGIHDAIMKGKRAFQPFVNDVSALAQLTGFDNPMNMDGPGGAAKGAELAFTRVVNQADEPLRVHHGTSRVFNSYDMSRMDEKTLYGPGIYHTESSAIAGGEPKGIVGGIQGAPNSQYFYDDLGYADKNLRNDHGFNYPHLLDRIQEEEQLLEKRLGDKANGHVQSLDFTGTWHDIDDVIQVHRDNLKYFEDKIAGHQPNVRHARLDIRNPFDLDVTVSLNQYGGFEERPFYDSMWQGKNKDLNADRGQLKKVLNAIQTINPNAEVEAARDRIIMELQTKSGSMDMTDIYHILAEIPVVKDARVGPSTMFQLPFEYTSLGKKRLNEAIEYAGFDGLTHLGGAMDHRVWIAHHPEQVRDPYSPPGQDLQWGHSSPATAAILAGTGVAGAAGYGLYQRNNAQSVSTQTRR